MLFDRWYGLFENPRSQYDNGVHQFSNWLNPTSWLRAPGSVALGDRAIIKQAHSTLLVMISITLIVMTTGCLPTSRQVSGSDILLTYSNGPVIRSQDYLDVFMTNTTRTCIEFPPDFGLKIYYLEKSSWIETGNLVSYPSPQNWRLDPHGTRLDTGAISLKPDLSHVRINGSLTFKATIRGHICNDPAAVVEKDIPFTVIPGK